jgi:hypothetical protein
MGRERWQILKQDFMNIRGLHRAQGRDGTRDRRCRSAKAVEDDDDHDQSDVVPLPRGWGGPACD